MAWTWYNSKVTAIDHLNDRVMEIELQLESDQFEFEAGQFITMDLPIHEKRLKRWRSYSIATAPSTFSENKLRFIVAAVPDGLASNYFWNEMKVGSAIKFKGPTGSFHLPKGEKKIDKDLVYICTGTGLVPCLSMMEELHKSGREYNKVHLIFGTRYLKDVFSNQWFKQVEEKYPEMNCTVALSREEPHVNPFPFELIFGYVHKAIDEEYSEVKPDVDFYICGWQNMVDEASAKLEGFGYEKRQVHVELYG